MTATPSIHVTPRRLTICLLAGGLLIAAVIHAVTSARRAPAPITPALLQNAAQAAEASGSGYDYSCQLYGAPRQILCQGQGDSVTFLVTRNDQLQPESGTG